MIQKIFELFDTISTNKPKKTLTEKKDAMDVNKKTGRIMKYMEYAKFCGPYQNSWTLDVRVGRWTLEAELWMLDSEFWTLDVRLWTLDSGL